MPIIESQVDRNGDDYRRNRERMLAAIEEFIAELRGHRVSEWERRFMALETEVHRVKRESKKRAGVTRVVAQQRSVRRRTG